MIFHAVNDSHSNADLPFIAGVSWVVYVVVALLLVKCVCFFRKLFGKSK